MTGSAEFALSGANGDDRPYLLDDKEKTMRMTKLLALAAVVVVAVACDGISPISPDAPVALEDAAAAVDARASTATDSALNTGCRGITKVDLQVISAADALDLAVQATYLNHGMPVRCSVGPTWTSRGSGRLTPTRDPFLVNVSLTTPPRRFQVNALAPNGVRGSIVFPVPASR